MSTTMHHAIPVSGRERITSLDVVRGVALCGILLVNIPGFGMPASLFNPPAAGSETGANLWAWMAMVMVFEGTQRGLFSLLFGASFIVFTKRLEAKGRDDAADIYCRRSLWLIVLGVIHAFPLLWFGDILFYYGVTALLLYPLRQLTAKAMLCMAAASLLANALWGLGEFQVTRTAWEPAQAAQRLLDGGTRLSLEQQADLEAWQAIEKKAKPDERTIRLDIEAHRGSYWDVLKFNAPMSAHSQSWGHYRLFFDVFSMMLIGMALFKLGVLTLKQPSKVYGWMVLIGYSIGLTINYHELQITLAGGFSVLANSRAHWTDEISRIAVTMGHLGALLLFCRSGWLQWLQRSLAAVGRMALSNYISQSIICAFVFYGFGFGLYGELERYQLYYVVVSIWIFQLIVSPIWLRYFRFGPLEWLWRSLTYLEPQPMRRGGRETAPASHTSATPAMSLATPVDVTRNNGFEGTRMSEASKDP